MNDLVVVVFDDELKADEGLITTKRLEARGQLEVRDAAIAVKTQRGRLRVRETTEISTSHRHGADGWWGLLITLLVGGPMGGTHYGDAFNQLYGHLDQVGIGVDFTTRVSEALEPGQSALFLLMRHGEEAAELGALDGLGGTLFRTPFADSSVEIIHGLFSASR